MRCCKCGRLLLRAAAQMPAGADHPAGPVGRACAVRAGLIEPKPALFSRTRKVIKGKAASRQMELLG
jgi:hypothetical protein